DLFEHGQPLLDLVDRGRRVREVRHDGHVRHLRQREVEGGSATGGVAEDPLEAAADGEERGCDGGTGASERLAGSGSSSRHLCFPRRRGRSPGSGGAQYLTLWVGSCGRIRLKDRFENAVTSEKTPAAASLGGEPPAPLEPPDPIVP